MQFIRVDCEDASGNPLPQTEPELFKCKWSSNNLSETITVIPVIDDGGFPQNVRLITKIRDEDFYEFSDGTFEKENRFMSDASFSFTIRLRRKPTAGVTSPPCNLFNTLVFSITDDGQKKRRQQSQDLFII